MDPVSELENAIGAELLRATMLGRPPPVIAHRYIVEGVLGRGASGLVLKALDQRLNRPVALKARPAVGDDAALGEARTLARLDHPNVVRVHDVDAVKTVLDGREFNLWLVSMARVEGRNMRDWLRAAPRSPQEILAVLVDVGRGIAAAHEAGIVHRDIKPDNVIVRGDGAAQVLDFGFAVQGTSSQSEFGGVRPAAGTDPYMAPEARLGLTSRRSDQFSLGVTLVEALTGTPMPAGRRVPDGVSPELWSVAERATSPERTERYSDVSAMVDAMAKVARLPTRRRVAPRTWVGGVVVCAALALVTWRWQPWRPQVRTVSSTFDAMASDAGTPPRTVVPIVDTPAETRRPGAAEGLARPEVVVARREDAVGPAARSVDAGAARLVDAGSVVRCRFASAQLEFVTQQTTGRGVSAGRYDLGVESRRGAPPHVAIRRTQPRVDQLEITSTTVEPGCEMRVGARAENRVYTFWLKIEGRSVRGRFSASGNPGYSGTVSPATVEPIRRR